MKDKMLTKQGKYVRHLRARMNMSVVTFAAKLNVDPNDLLAVEEGLIKIPREMLGQLILLTDVYEYEMEQIYREHYWDAVQEIGTRSFYINHTNDIGHSFRKMI
ncbi:hypothetical protein ACFLWG_01775 [Chloroflexota bacterium]